MLDDYNLIGNNLLIKCLSEDETTKSGLVLKRTFGDGTPYIKGIVVKAGPGKVNQSGVRIPMLVQEGYEIALFGDNSLTIFIEDEAYLIASEEMLIFYKKGTMAEFEAAIAALKDIAEKDAALAGEVMNPRGKVNLDQFHKGDK